METIPVYLLWGAFGVVALVSVLLGALMIGLALVGRYRGAPRPPIGPAAGKLEADLL